MARADVIPTSNCADIANFSGAGTNYAILANNGARYLVYVDRTQDVYFTKSTDGGFTWAAPTLIFTGTTQALAVWYDRWSGRSTDKIRCAYSETGGSDILYRDIDTASSDALGTQTTVFNGTSVAGGGSLTIVTGRNGHIRVAGSIDAGAEDGAWSSTDDGATWGDTIADPSEGATQDQYFLLPGWNNDTADVMLIFVDASANGLSVKRYDDSGDSWAESAIIADASFVDQLSTTAFPHVACAVDITNSQNVVIAWNAVDAANQDLKCYTITDTTITTKTDVVTDATDDCGLCALAIDTANNIWYAFWGGKTDGSETYPTAINIYYKTSSDGGSTWGSAVQLSAGVRDTEWLIAIQRFTGDFMAVWYDNLTQDALRASVAIPSGMVAPMFDGGVMQ